MPDLPPEHQEPQPGFEILQENYRAIMDTLQDSYFEADKTGFVTYANWGFIKNTGYDSREDVIGRHFRHFTHRSGIKDVYKNFKKVFESGQPVPPFEYRYRRKDGTLMIGDAYISPIITENEVVGTRGLLRDITAKLNAEQALRAAKTEAETRAKELAALNRLATIVTKSLDFDEILQTICVEFTHIFPVRNTGIALLNVDRTSQELVAFHSTESTEESALGLHIPLQKFDASWEAMETKKPVVIHNALSDIRVKSMWEVYKRRGTRSVMIVPLLTRGNAIGTIGLPAKDPEHIFSQNEIDLAETIASQISTAVDNARLYAQIEKALDVAESDLEIGRQIQSGFFPENLPKVPGWEIAAHFQSARQVAGDFYDVFQFTKSDFLAFIIADVCDKGVGAALFMVLFRSLLRAFSDRPITHDNVENHLLDIVNKTNNFIANIHGKSNMFATLFFGILNPRNGELHYINGGHESPIILDAQGSLIGQLMPTGPAVGMFPDMEFQVEKIQFQPGASLIGYTDGVTDAKSSAGEHFTEKRLLNHIAYPWTSSFSMLFELNAEVIKHIGGQPQFDDITLISFRRKLDGRPDCHAICRTAQMNHLNDLRDFVGAAAKYCLLKQDDILALKLAAEEVCTNIIQHGYEEQEPGDIAVMVEIEDNLARLIISDDGKSFSPEQAKSPDIEADWNERDIGGLGIYFVKELMDSVFYAKTDDGSNELILEKELKS
jgi:PAS domain S-box-containing protein